MPSALLEFNSVRTHYFKEEQGEIHSPTETTIVFKKLILIFSTYFSNPLTTLLNELPVKIDQDQQKKTIFYKFL